MQRGADVTYLGSVSPRIQTQTGGFSSVLTLPALSCLIFAAHSFMQPSEHLLCTSTECKRKAFHSHLRGTYYVPHGQDCVSLTSALGKGYSP